MPNSCTVCMNNSGKNKDISFFSYPKDQVQRHEWLQAVGRQDLIAKLEEANARRNYRICEQHFESNCFKFSKFKTVKYLTENAYPTLNIPYINDGECTSRCEGRTESDNQKYENIPLAVDTEEQNTILPDQGSYSVQVNLNDFASKMNEDESRSSQTALHLSAGTLRKRKLYSELQKAKESKTFDLDSVTEEDFLELCEKFLSKNMVQLIKWQIDLRMDYSSDRESTKASTTEVQTITSRIKTNAQRCREYRERKKLQNTMVQNITAERSNECSETDQLPAKKPKTNAERSKKYYEAQKLKKQKSKKIPKTAKQRNKEYYYRKKKIQALNTLNPHSDVQKLKLQKSELGDTTVVEMMKIEHPDKATPEGATETWVFVEDSIKVEPEEPDLSTSDQETTAEETEMKICIEDMIKIEPEEPELDKLDDGVVNPTLVFNSQDPLDIKNPTSM